METKKNRLKVVHINPSLNIGGAERFVVDLCNELALKNDQLDVWLVSLYDNNLGDTFLDQISERVNYISFSKSPGFDIKVLYKLTKWLLKIKPDVVNTHMGAFEYIVPFNLIKSRNVCFCHTVHTDPFREMPIRIFQNIRRFFYRKENVTPINISTEGARSFKELYNIDKGVIIPNGRPKLKFNTINKSDLFENHSVEGLLFVHVGRIMKEKNQELLLNAFNIFNSKNNFKHKLLIIGEHRDKEIYSRLQSLIVQNDSVIFLGAKFNIGDYLNIADAFCLSSNYEGMPISLIEAFSMGCIPICTSVGGIKEMVVDGFTGFLSEDLTVDSYVNAFERFANSKFREDVSQNGEEQFRKKYSIEVCAANYLRAYNVI